MILGTSSIREYPGGDAYPAPPPARPLPISSNDFDGIINAPSQAWIDAYNAANGYPVSTGSDAEFIDIPWSESL